MQLLPPPLRSATRFVGRSVRRSLYRARYAIALRRLRKNYGDRLRAVPVVDSAAGAEEIWEGLRAAAPAGVSFYSASLASAPFKGGTFHEGPRSPYAGLGNAPEKAAEHHLTFALFDSTGMRRHCDVAASASPFEAVCRESYPEIEYWKQDLVFQTDLARRVVGGFAQSMREVADGFFDSMSLHCSFEHFEGDADGEFVREVGRVLGPTGACLVAPLYLDLSPKIFFDPTLVAADHLDKFDREALLCAAFEYRQDHGRYYSPATLRERVLDRLPSGLHASLVRLRDAEAGVYLKFALVLHRERSIFRPGLLTAERR